MTSVFKTKESAERASLLRRMRRLEGQAAGITRMIEGDRAAADVLQQFSALLAASREASVEYALTSLRDRLGRVVDDGAKVDDLVDEVRLLLERASRLP